MSKWACYYHAVWATDQRSPTLLGPRTEAMERMIAAISRDQGCKTIAIGSQPDHVHLGSKGGDKPPLRSVPIGHAPGCSARVPYRAWPARPQLGADTRMVPVHPHRA